MDGARKSAPPKTFIIADEKMLHSMYFAETLRSGEKWVLDFGKWIFGVKMVVPCGNEGFGSEVDFFGWTGHINIRRGAKSGMAEKKCVLAEKNEFFARK